MVNVIGPLFSLDAKGTFGKVLTFFSKFGQSYASYAALLAERRHRIPSKLVSQMSGFFKGAWDNWKILGPLAVGMWEYVAEGKSLLGRCSFFSTYLETKGARWAEFPFPPQFALVYYTDQIADYEQKMADMETLTGLFYLKKPEAFYTEFEITEAIGQSNWSGEWYVLPSSLFENYPPDEQLNTIYHEMAHCLMLQHGYLITIFKMQESEEVASEIAARLVAGELVPLYRYSKTNETLHEIVYGW